MASDRIQRRIERLLDQIEEAADQLNWPEVLDRAKALLAYEPENQDALTLIDVANRALGESQQSPEHLINQSGRSIPEQPTSFANGRYQVKRFLGEGGKKKVYLAHDTTLDREVAFALIKTDGLDETSPKNRLH